MTPLVSVIIPSYQSVNTLRESVESVLNQTHSFLECLIIDDGSQDGGYELAKELEKTDTRIRVFTHPQRANRGVSASRNIGLDNCQGSFVAFLDSDDVWLADKLSNQLSAFDGRPDVGLVFSDTYICKNPDPRLPMEDQALVRDPSRANISELFDGNQRKSAEALFFIDASYLFIPSPTPLVRTELFRAGLRFFGPPLLNIQYEDFLMWKCLALKCGILALSEPTSIYRVHEKSFTGQFQKTKSLLHHLDGLEQVDNIILTCFSVEIEALGWRSKINAALNESYKSAVAVVEISKLQTLALIFRRRGIFFQFVTALVDRLRLSIWYSFYDSGRFLRGHFRRLLGSNSNV